MRHTSIWSLCKGPNAEYPVNFMQLSITQASDGMSSRHARQNDNLISILSMKNHKGTAACTYERLDRFVVVSIVPARSILSATATKGRHGSYLK